MSVFIEVLHVVMVLVTAVDFALLLPIGERKKASFKRETLLFVVLATGLTLILVGQIIRTAYQEPLTYRFFLDSIYVVCLMVWLLRYVRLPLPHHYPQWQDLQNPSSERPTP